MQHDAQFIALRAQLALHRQAPGTEGVVGLDQLVAVQPDLGEGIEPFEHQVAAGGPQGMGRRVEARAVFPVRQADPLQAGLGRGHIRIGDELVREQVGMHRARHRGRAPGCRFRMRTALGIAGQETEGPALVDHDTLRRTRRRRRRSHGEHRREQQREQHPRQRTPAHAAGAFQ
jgi:hypothetical protein